MPVILPDLPYAPDALAPAISAETFAFHHGKHHKAYVDKTNQLIAGTPLADAPLEEIVLASAGNGDGALFNQSAQAWNHGFFWRSLCPGGGKPDHGLAFAIDTRFGSLDKLVAAMIKQGASHFGSGWVWLVMGHEGLALRTTHDAGCPLVDGERPLLVLDLWEHAYYLDHRNDRKAWLKAACALLDWEFASHNFARKGAWTYPD
jgi:superoxide dismutase, Fe-Mn family